MRESEGNGATITLADAEMYLIRSGESWANVVVDEDTGTLMSLGSEGVFAATWPPARRGGLKRTLHGLSLERFCSTCNRTTTDPAVTTYWQQVWPHVLWALGPGERDG